MQTRLLEVRLTGQALMKYASEFLDVINRSGLIPVDVLNFAVDEYKAEHGQLDVEGFAESLVKKKILTDWQRRHLLKGKSKGFLIGQYKILNLLGRGGHSNVYRAEHVTLKQDRVVKVLLPGKINTNSSLMSRFIREAQATARLDHPNIIRCYDIVTDKDLSYLVMEYVAGQDLHVTVQQDGPLPFAKCVDFICQAARGLEYVNKHGLIHRDIKPANMLVTKHGVVKILDLGLAMLDQGDDEDGSLTEMYNDNLGTADYIAPEQALNSHAVDFRADIYSLGCSLYYLLVGRPPFDTGPIMQRIAQHQREMPQTIAEQRPNCPKKLEQICWKMIQKAPADRFQSYADIVSALQNLLKKPVAKTAGQQDSHSTQASASSLPGSNLGAQMDQAQADGDRAVNEIAELEEVGLEDVATGAELTALDENELANEDLLISDASLGTDPLSSAASQTMPDFGMADAQANAAQETRLQQPGAQQSFAQRPGAPADPTQQQVPQQPAQQQQQLQRQQLAQRQAQQRQAQQQQARQRQAQQAQLQKQRQAQQRQQQAMAQQHAAQQQQPFAQTPGFPQQGMPQQSFPQQSFPQQGMPQQSMPHAAHQQGFAQQQPAMPTPSSIHAATPSSTMVGPGGSPSSNSFPTYTAMPTPSPQQSEDEAYKKFVKNERMKMVWVGLGTAVGIGIAVAIMVAINAANKAAEEDKKLPPPTNRESSGETRQ